MIRKSANTSRRQPLVVELMRQPSVAEVAMFRERLLAWFAQHGRQFPWRCPKATLYQRVLPEILLQRTRAETVAEFLPKFVRRFPSWRALARATERELGELLRPLGLWRRRASSLLRLARDMGVRGGRFPTTRAKVENLPGVGQYIANAICLFALKRPEPLLDVNMARVIERCFGPRRLADIRYDPRLQEVARRIIDGPDAAKVNWAILDLAALTCRKNNPCCSHCPLLIVCTDGQRRVNHVGNDTLQPRGTDRKRRHRAGSKGRTDKTEVIRGRRLTVD